jgi:hypothetical protein
MYYSTAQKYYPFQAGGWLPWWMNHVNMPEKNINWLVIKGIIVDVIDIVGEDHREECQLMDGSMVSDIPDLPIQGWIDELDEIAAMEPSYYRTTRALHEARWQTMVMGAIAPEPYSYEDTYNILRDRILPPPHEEIASDGKSARWHYEISVLDFMTKANQAVASLTLARSSAGMLCKVPYGTQPGDQIVVFLGAMVPFVLRRRPGGSTQETGYRVLGACYAHGIMRGEMLDGRSEDHELVQELVLN